MAETSPPITVSGCFDDCVAAEIACALLADASLQPDQPEFAVEGEWLVSVRDLKPIDAGRAEVILKRARARGLRSLEHADSFRSLHGETRR